MRVLATPGAEVAAQVRAAGGESVVVIVSPTLDPHAAALARAAIGPLAIGRAPGQRVNAICGSIDARDADVEAAIAFLEGAGSTTGQVLEVGRA